MKLSLPFRHLLPPATFPLFQSPIPEVGSLRYVFLALTLIWTRHGTTRMYNMREHVKIFTDDIFENADFGWKRLSGIRESDYQGHHSTWVTSALMNSQ